MVELTKNENNQAVFKFTVSADKFAKAQKEAYNKTKGRYNIPGFRKGKAPANVIKNFYGEGVFFEEAINIALPEAYEAAVTELGLDTVERPDIDILEIEAGKDVVVQATVTCKPEVVLGAYKGVEVEKAVYEVTEEDINTELEKEQTMNARMVTIEDRAAQDGDTLVIDYKGFIDGEQFEGGTAENHTLVLGSNSFIGDFEKQLEGKSTGEEAVVEVAFPEDYHAEHLAGKPARFEVKVNEIKFKEVPALDDEFAKDVSEFDTLEEYKASIKEKITAQNEERAKNETRENIVQTAVGTATIDLPEVMIENEVENMLMDFDYQLRYQGIDLDSYLKYTNTTKDDLKERMREDAEIRVRTSLVIEAIAKAEDIKATDELVEAELVKIAEQQKSEVEKIRKTYARDDYSIIRNAVESRLTVDFLVENANLK
ncbi:MULTISPECIES: trigger factor [unclassified Fusibacter]|uniref:trigger factor n=1 Tax=unclassified Fusibacter TaxID=2624464 RepID=UPI001A9C2129|nr:MULTISPECIES: trigger factor [unclassified Fusibacter]MCK8061657.1 trigger factor [Fusibacter sp. A2]